MVLICLISKLLQPKKGGILMKRIMVFSLVLLLFCTSALAEVQQRINLGKTGCYDDLRYYFTLPDGRLVFCGTQANPGNYHKAHARLLILNPDLTVNADYLDPTVGECRYTGAVLLPDGCIGAVMSNNPYQDFGGMELQFFTQDGAPVDKPIPLDYAEAMTEAVTPSCVFISVTLADGSSRCRVFLDWNGKVLFRLAYEDYMGSVPAMIETEDGLVFAGCSPDYPVNAKIMKMDFAGNPVWENTLPGLLDNGNAEIRYAQPTLDDGFLGLMMDRSLDAWTGNGTWAYALVKFDRVGQVEWMNREISEKLTDMSLSGLFEYQGQYFLMVKDRNKLDSPQRILFRFDSEGNLLRQTEIVFDQVNENYGCWPVPTESGLWFLIDSMTEDDDIYKEMDTRDMWLVKVPE